MRRYDVFREDILRRDVKNLHDIQRQDRERYEDGNTLSSYYETMILDGTPCNGVGWWV